MCEDQREGDGLFSVKYERQFLGSRKIGFKKLSEYEIWKEKAVSLMILTKRTR